MTRVRLLGIGILLLAVLQVALPLVALTGPRPTRFGWQMFTAYVPAPVAWTEGADGRLEPVGVEAILLHPRAEADVTDALVERLCAEGGVVAVVVERAGERSRHPCP